MEEKNSKSKKSIIIIVVAIVVIIAIITIIGVVGSFINGNVQKQLISKEIDKINSTRQVDKEIKSKGKYADVEKVLKDYVLEYQSVANEIKDQYQNQKFTTILSADNYKNDGPEFTESRKLISDAKAKGEEVKTKLNEMVTDEYKEKRAKDNGLSGKYKELFVDSIQFEKELEEVNSTIDNVNNYLAKIEDVFNFLNENKDNWEVKNTRVEFNQISLVTKYNSLITSVNIAAQKMR